MPEFSTGSTVCPFFHPKPGIFAFVKEKKKTSSEGYVSSADLGGDLVDERG